MTTRFQRIALVVFTLLVPRGMSFVAAAPEDARSTSNKAASDPWDPLEVYKFAPMWEPFTLVTSDPEFDDALPNADYAMLWNPQWQELAGLTDTQQKQLEEIGAEVRRDAKSLKRITSKPLRAQIEAVLSVEQLQSFRNDRFAGHAIAYFYDSKLRRKLALTMIQETRFQAIARERMAKVQLARMQCADKLWELLTAEQQAALPEVVRRQGPTSAVLSIAFELGMNFENSIPTYPMLATVPVRERLKLSADQRRQLQKVAEDAETRHKAEQAGEPRATDESNDERRVQAILTPEQRTLLDQIEFRRKVLLAMGYPEKQASIGVSADQKAALERLEQETFRELFRIDHAMIQKAAGVFSPDQREQLRRMISEQP